MDKLSKVQKEILIWLLYKTRFNKERGVCPDGVDWKPCRRVVYVYSDYEYEANRMGLEGKPTASDRAAFSRSLKRLEARSLIIRKHNYWLFGCIEVKLTEKGENIAQMVNETRPDYVNRWKDEIELVKERTNDSAPPELC